MAGDEIGHQELLRLAGLRGRFLEVAGELAEVVDRRLLHQLQHAGIGVLRGDLEPAADVMRRQFA